MPFTLEQLFQHGAHRSVEQLVLENRATITEISAVLGRRFGAENIPGPDVLGELRGRVFGSINTGNALERGINPLPSEYAVNPAITDAFSYTVVAEIPDPFAPPPQPGQQPVTVSIPWTINSPTTMTLKEIFQRAGEELAAGVPEQDYLPIAQNAANIRRRIRFSDAVKEAQYEPGDFTLYILGVYRRG
jgi:hypothetical protein